MAVVAGLGILVAFYVSPWVIALLFATLVVLVDTIVSLVKNGKKHR